MLSTTMVQRHQESHELWNQRNLDALASYFEPRLHYTEHSRSEKIPSLSEMRRFITGWWESFSDAQITDAEYFEAGEWTICKFTLRGTNDGPFGRHPPTARKVAFDCCELIHWTERGTAQAGDLYTSLLSLMIQLGFLPNVR